MVVIEFKIPHGLKAKARREGYSLVKYSNQLFYHLRKKNSPKIGKNHHKFGNTMQELKISYRKLNDAEKLALKERRKKEGSTKSDWIQFVREYYRGTSRQALKEKRQVKAQNKKDQVNKPQKGIESKNLREMKSDETCSRSSDFRHSSPEVPCLGLRKSGLQQLSDFRQLIFVRSPLTRAEEVWSPT
jgi:Zn-finger domain-containing protein